MSRRGPILPGGRDLTKKKERVCRPEESLAVVRHALTLAETGRVGGSMALGMLASSIRLGYSPDEALRYYLTGTPNHRRHLRAAARTGTLQWWMAQHGLDLSLIDGLRSPSMEVTP